MSLAPNANIFHCSTRRWGWWRAQDHWDRLRACAYFTAGAYSTKSVYSLFSLCFLSKGMQATSPRPSLTWPLPAPALKVHSQPVPNVRTQVTTLYISFFYSLFISYPIMNIEWEFYLYLFWLNHILFIILSVLMMDSLHLSNSSPRPPLSSQPLAPAYIECEFNHILFSFLLYFLVIYLSFYVPYFTDKLSTRWIQYSVSSSICYIVCKM